MKCRACGFDSDGKRDEEGFIYLDVRSQTCVAEIKGTFPQYETVPLVMEQVLLFACPRCGTVRISNWRLEGC